MEVRTGGGGGGGVSCCCVGGRAERRGRAVLTDRLGLEGADPAAFAFAFAVDGGHLDLVGGLGVQLSDGDGHVCLREG